MAVFSKLKAKRAFRKASKEATDKGEMLCSTIGPDGTTPLYWVMPFDATNEAVRAKAFEVRYGRPMSEIEKTFLRKADERAAADEVRGYL